MTLQEIATGKNAHIWLAIIRAPTARVKKKPDAWREAINQPNIGEIRGEKRRDQSSLCDNGSIIDLADVAVRVRWRKGLSVKLEAYGGALKR